MIRPEADGPERRSRLYGNNPPPKDLPPAGYKTVQRLYEQASDARNMLIFPGDFINFGYWRDLRGQLWNEATRIESQKQLYGLMFERLGVKPETDDTILEVGCGKGKGLQLLANIYAPKGKIIGVDMVAEQVERTRETLSTTPGNFLIYQNAAEALIDIPDNSVDLALSVEAMQHFESPQRFVAELGRVVRPGGRIAITTFFAGVQALSFGKSSEDIQNELIRLFPHMEVGIDHAIPTTDFESWLEESGFVNIKRESIRDDVLPHFSQWMNDVLPDYNSTAYAYASNWGLLDYMVYTAERKMNLKYPIVYPRCKYD